MDADIDESKKSSIMSVNGNRNVDTERNRQPRLRRSALRALVQDFSPMWYVDSMVQISLC